MPSQLKAPQNQTSYKRIVDEICRLNWDALSSDEMIDVAWAYYYFSTHFRETMELALEKFPQDDHLVELDRGERNTDNLSPYPGVAAPGEKMHHEEYMRRTLALTPISDMRRQRLEALGRQYLNAVHSVEPDTRVASLASYEDGGLEAVFTSILRAKNWDGALQGAFKHFLVGHVHLDSDPEGGHGALCRHIPFDDRVVPLWSAFRDIFVQAQPALTVAKAA